jgi:hypothetical protein
MKAAGDPLTLKPVVVFATIPVALPPGMLTVRTGVPGGVEYTVDFPDI